MERVPTLPLPLFSSVVGFAVPDFSEEIVSDKRSFFFASNHLKNLALVSKSWHNSVRELVAQCQRSTLTLKFHTASRPELLEMRTKVLARGRHVTDLRISMGQVGSFGEYFSLGRRLPETLDTLELGWDALIARMPGLRRLDLSEMPLCSPHTVKVVEAATKSCRELEALILPGKEHYEMHPGAEIDPLLDAVYKGLESWRPAGHRRGLRQLKVPTINEKTRFQSCRKFFDKLVTLCPQVEYLDGYKQSLCEMDRLTCQDVWLLNLEDWRKFNAACTSIREFNWVVAPFADPYFEVFGEYVKPQLTKLIFCINMLWDWEKYFVELDREAGLLARSNIVDVGRAGYGWFARNPSSALLGCPGLQELEIALYGPPDEDELDDPFTYNRDQGYFPDDEVLEKSIFGDEFWETLATNCPLINRIALWEVVEGLELHHIHSFTDRGLIALAQLKYLDFMELRPINCTGSGLFEFLNGFSDEFTGQRTFQICVGSKSIMPEHERTDLNFYDAVMSLLTRLADTHASDLRMSQQRIVLRLKNAIASSVERDWGVDYLERLKKVVDRVKETHLSLRLRITAHGYNGVSFRSISELGLYAAHAEPSVWFGWDEQESNRDVVFVNRGGVPYIDESSEAAAGDDDEGDSGSDYDMERDNDEDFAL
ncbi:hypothetical protein PHYSODRAFT_331622 [Phytophthora sojae]|uniref:Uncharacterized protein n=1 Tax=Phytophthora sojae (strain P6497) TaxID=1094619 RepID=G4ZIM3_PHYSP|nr:hypothetical protein PHYSODRAFT_331622 [Phytophthora sojae]EGZ17684.1 hypothetical protein PHYSODRAFT_331622 [Phytophthora sojae]|eukprot:XP_009526742.1 hypothetical protein PHYSODRAFT_331622 [Phytophthora sojae]